MEGDAQFARFLDILARRSRMVAAITVCGTIAVGLLAWSLPTNYTAKAQVVIEDNRGVPSNTVGLIRDAGADQATILTEVTALRSDALLKVVFLQLRSDPAFQAIHAKAKPAASETERSAEMPGGSASSNPTDTAVWTRWLNEIGAFRFPLTKGSPDAAPAAPGELTMKELNERLKVYQELGSHVISVTFTSTSAEEAALVVNKLVSVYVDQGDAQRHASLDRAVLGLEVQTRALKSEMDILDAFAAAYQTAHGLNDGTKANLVDQKLVDLNRQLSDAQTDLAARSSRRVSLLALRGDVSDWGPFLSRLGTAGLVDLHNQLMGLLQSRQASIVTVRPSDREPGGGDQAETRPLRAKLGMLLDQALQKLTDDQNVAEARVTAIKQRLDAVQTVSDDRRLRELVTAAAASRHRYERLIQRRDELIEQRDGLSPMVGLLSQASPPDRPSSHNPVLFVPPGAIASLMFACMVALILARMERTLHSESDVRAILGIRCVGMVPRLPRGSASHRPLSVPFVVYTEAIRSIMVSLQLSRPRLQASNVILVTSSVPDEGKSTLATSLASYATRAGARVLLLDLDIGGAMAAWDHLDQPKGTMGELLDRDSIPIDTIRTQDGTELDYLPVRRGMAKDPLPLFSPDLVMAFLRRLRTSYDYIIIDSTPVLVAAEVRLLAAFADKILFVVRWGKTKRVEARRALELLLQACNTNTETADLVSAVITQVDLNKHARRHSNDDAEAFAKYSSYYISEQVR